MLGGALGELLRIEHGLEALGHLLRRRLGSGADDGGGAEPRTQGPGRTAEPTGTGPRGPGRPEARGPNGPAESDAHGSPGPSEREARASGPAGPDDPAGRRFVEGFVSASLLFCVGPLTILGSLSDGLGRGSEQLLVKSVLDGSVALILASTLGAGVGLSALSVLVVQGALTAAAGQLAGALSDRMIDELTATGGIILLGLALRLLDVKQVRVASFLPALVLCPLLVALFAR